MWYYFSKAIVKFFLCLCQSVGSSILFPSLSTIFISFSVSVGSCIEEMKTQSSQWWSLSHNLKTSTGYFYQFSSLLHGHPDSLTHLLMQMFGVFPESYIYKPWKQVKDLNLNLSGKYWKVKISHCVSIWRYINIAAIFRKFAWFILALASKAILCKFWFGRKSLQWHFLITLVLFSSISYRSLTK